MVKQQCKSDPLSITSNCMVRLSNAWKTYDGKNYILKGLNINILKGEIYSLLGSSGTGKTTLLQSIVGNICLNSGDISVDITSRLDIGYMPQEIALYTDLTLNETFQFFGLMLFMTQKEIKTRMHELIDLLDLPPSNTQIESLSGGQQRRISIAVAMLKNPPFLILDEPTASLDSVLKQSIWMYLMKITQEENKTILLTTHYIEEANNSSKVGFMSNGQILLEGSPAQVKHTSDPPFERLEDVYYQLCKQNQSADEFKTIPQGRAVKSLSRFSEFSMKRVMAFTLKSVYYFRRNILALYVFICPALTVMAITEAFAEPKGINLGYVNFENNCTEASFNCTTPLSCRMIKYLAQNDFNMIRYDSIDEGKKAVLKNYAWGLIKFSWNFSDGIENRNDYFFSGKHVEVPEDDEALVWLDMSAYPVSYKTKKHFYDSFLKSIKSWYDDCGWNVRAAHPILRIEKPLYGVMNKGLASSGIPIVIVLVTFSLSAMMSIMFVLTEKELGTLNRCKVNGLKTYELLISIFITCFTVIIPTGMTLLLILYFYSGPSNGPVFWCSFLYYLQAANGILSGIFIGLHTHRLADALLMTIGFLYALKFVSGVLWPPEGFHWIGKILYMIFPSSIPGNAFRILANKGFDNIIYTGLAYSLTWTAILIVFIIITLKLKEEKN